MDFISKCGLNVRNTYTFMSIIGQCSQQPVTLSDLDLNLWFNAKEKILWFWFKDIFLYQQTHMGRNEFP